MVCADVTFDPLSVIQTAGTGTGSLGTTPTDVQVKFVMSGLPASSPALCLVACVVDGDITIFSLPLFEACGTTSAAGKLTVNQNIPLVDIAGGCLVPLMAVAVTPPPVEPITASGVPIPETAVICAPGFGTFAPFEPPVCLTACDN